MQAERQVLASIYSSMAWPAVIGSSGVPGAVLETRRTVLQAHISSLI